MNFNVESIIEELGALAGIAIGLLVFIALIAIGVVIYTIIVTGMVYKKAGQPAWAAWVPGYTVWVKCKVAGCHWLMFAIAMGVIVINLFVESGSFFENLITLLAYAVDFFIYWNLAKKFGKGVGYTIGLTLIPVVFLSILAFSKNTKYLPDAEVKNCAFFDVDF